MKKWLFAAVLLQYVSKPVFSQLQHGRIDSILLPALKMHYQQEFTFDSPADPARWQVEKPGLHAAFGSTDQVYFRSEVPPLKMESNAWEATGWKGERINAMIVVWSPDSLEQVRFVLNDLKDSRGNVLTKNNLQLNMVQYVISNYPYDAREVTCGVGPTDQAYLMPDRLESFDRFDLPGRSVRPVWLSINIPSATAQGIYRGKIEVRSDKGNVELPFQIKIQPQLLAAPRNWAFQLDLWQNPSVISDYYKVKPWSEEHKTLLKTHLKLYADAGGKFITTYAVHSPWSDNSYMEEGGMIEWIKRKNGSWKFDYSIFDQYVQLCMQAGIDKAITIYTPIPWGERFRYIDESSGNYIHERWIPTSDTFSRRYLARALRPHVAPFLIPQRRSAP